MDLKTKQQIDHVVGRPLCTALTAFDRVVRALSGKPAAPAGIRRVLVIKFWGMGSIILAAAGVRRIRQEYPGARIVFLTLGRNREILEMLGVCDEIVCLEIDRGVGVLAAGVAGLLLRLRRMKLDLVIDLEFFTRFSAIITYLTAAPLRGGFYDWQIWRGDLHNIRVPFNRYWYTRRNFENLVARCINTRTGDDAGFVRPQAAGGEREKLEALLAARGIGTGRTLVCVNANAGELASERRWPGAHFAELCRVLADEPGCDVVLIGSEREAAYVRRIRDEAGRPNIHELAGALSLGMLAELLQRSKLLVTNDSGPLHLAVALDVPTVSLFGPETPVLYAPPQNGRHIVFFKNIDCSPCINVHNGKLMKCCRTRPECLESITVAEVVRAIRGSGLLEAHG
jgi:ADP-heptose:LPS heptosyltransferase